MRTGLRMNDMHVDGGKQTRELANACACVCACVCVLARVCARVCASMTCTLVRPEMKLVCAALVVVLAVLSDEFSRRRSAVKAGVLNGTQVSQHTDARARHSRCGNMSRELREGGAEQRRARSTLFAPSNPTFRARIGFRLTSTRAAGGGGRHGEPSPRA